MTTTVTVDDATTSATTAPKAATTAATPAAPASPTLSAKLSADWSWIVSHIVALIVCAAFIVGGVYLVESVIAKHDAARAAEITAGLTAQAAQTKSLQDQLAADEKAASDRDVAYQKTISQLTQMIGARDVAAQKQQAVDAALSAAAAAQRIAQQTQAQPGEVTSTPTTVTVDNTVARRVTSSLDALPVAQSDLADTQKQLTAQQTLTNDAVANTTEAQKVIASQTEQIADAGKACDARVTAANAKARTGKWKAFGLGVATVLAFMAGHAL